MSDVVHHSMRSVLDRELAEARELSLKMGEFVEDAIAGAVEALVEGDAARCDAVVAGDVELNALQLQMRELAIATIVTQAPVDGDLRRMLAYLHMSAELERMGDHCVSIAKIGRELCDPRPAGGLRDLVRMSELCGIQLHEMLEAVVEGDVEGARIVASHDDRVDRIYRRLFDEEVRASAAGEESAATATRLTLVAHHLERIADRVTNMGEDLVYLQTGIVEELG
ncbi:MAG TPA: phosphate signaling complex protein PhoU [Candidatus Dormibacteraeota bacterium]|nr:phosphate signaling complex protein PhoU [Candidatus Dormibacteraeota bacterium]